MGRVNKVKGLRSTNWQLKKSHRDVKHSRGNIVSNIKKKFKERKKWMATVPSLQQWWLG